MAKVQDVLRFNDKGLSVDEARKRMLEAGEAPTGRARATVPAVAADALEPEIEDTGEVVVAANPNAEQQAAEAKRIADEEARKTITVVQPTLVTPVEEKTERIENELFVAEIKQEKNKWVAELQYKSGAGTERFIAGSKNELMLKLLEGKGHATLRVKEAVRREKLGGPKLDKSYQLPADISAEEFGKMTTTQQQYVIDAIAAHNALEFREKHPEYYRTKANGEALDNFLREHDLPYTVVNLEYALEDMLENDLFPDKRPEVAAVAPKSLTQPEIVTRVEDSPAAAPPAAPASPASRTEGQPTVTVRKRGSTGLPTEHSSVPSDAGPARAEDGGTPREPSEAELRKLSLPELKRIADADRRQRAQVR